MSVPIPSISIPSLKLVQKDLLCLCICSNLDPNETKNSSDTPVPSIVIEV
uniref:Uncharacterized protein n=1 Tax=Anguilla anguilla TaxID=7936 RepID=A0A0E9WU10_ANGAN